MTEYSNGNDEEGNSLDLISPWKNGRKPRER
jgi:hypothetical protein